MRKRTILIAGPTASGKSAAALALAEKVGGEIVNADALQVYHDLTILSARPTAADVAQAPHHLYGIVDGAVRYSAGEWSRAAAPAINDIHRRGKAAIIAGGTGLYFRALERGLSLAPPIPDEVRAAAAERFESIGADAFRAEVLAFDPGMARLAPADRQRHIRAWEVFKASGAPLSEIQRRPGAPLVDRIDAKIIIDPPRAALYAAIDARFDRMVADGALAEAKALLDRDLDRGLPVMKAVGAAELIAYLRGVHSLDDATLLAKQNTRRFAKRQMTWFRHQAADWLRAASPLEAADAAFVASASPRG
ncbi:MAG: tRNA (adenosine(37)-N6)-dimethylallyltransferase MiaA [Alphaproteobacteria bacterium RIFCSPHIGHO2_12_FULL_63_12]|nr:MAG: tRNA (adenosine(37)-N6)-dimethylallyltransferase MiaA [Alphaproteobacteria bacterium RIFCSPHIGHO2_12_FULL_63_12]